MWGVVQKLNEGLTIDERAAPSKREQSNDNDFSREENKTILKLSAKESLTKAAVEEFVKNWLQQPRDEYWTLSGPELGRKFTIQFIGSGQIAARRADKANQSQRLGPGSWQRHKIGAAADGKLHDVFIGVDKNLNTVKTEMAIKRIKKAVVFVFPSLASLTYGVKSEGVLSIDFVPTAKVIVHPVEETTIQWNNAAVSQFNLDKERIASKFKELMGDKAKEVEWCG